jgi:hypothetical protein
MNIKQNTKYILEHPYTKKAIDEYNNGDSTMLEHLIFEVQFHAFDKTALLCSKVYGLNKWNNTVVIKDIIRNVEPPENLSISLSIPKKGSK